MSSIFKTPVASVVLVHGLWMSGSEMILLRWRLRRAGFRVFIYRYSSVRKTLKENRDRFSKFMESVPGDEVHFIGHSLGGILVERFLHESGFSASGRVVALGSPFNGCFAAERTARFRWLRFYLGRSLMEMMEEARRSWRQEQALGVIAGTLPWGAGYLLGPLPGPNDGVILVDETRVEGMTDHLSLKVNHFGLLLSGKVSAEIIHFLRNGRFRDGSLDH